MILDGINPASGNMPDPSTPQVISINYVNPAFCATPEVLDMEKDREIVMVSQNDDEIKGKFEFKVYVCI